MACRRKAYLVEALERFPLIIPEADAGVRKGLDEALRRAGSARLDVALEIGGWGTILAYGVGDGLGVGIVSEAAVVDRRG